MILDRSFDKSNLFDILNDFPKQFKEGLEVAKNVGVHGKFKNVVVCGMGGSALPADVLKTYMPVIDMPLYVSRNYNLPFEADGESFVICISHSGNTEETLSCFREALHLHCKTACITSGGRLKEMCEENGIPLALVPKGPPHFQPRYALGHTFAALVKILSNSGVIPPHDREVLELSKTLREFNFHEQAKQIAKRLYKRIPLVYSSEKNRRIARIWKTKFNETSKIMAFYNYFPELNHNEMTGHTESKTQGNFHTIFLRDKTDHPRIRKRMNLLAKLIKSRGEEITFIDMMGDEDKLTKIFSAILFGDWIAYYLAGEYRVDPTPVELVEEFKKELVKD